LRWIGHRDLIRCFERLFRRAGLPLKRSEGFHPKPRMTFPSALAVGIAGCNEVMEVELTEAMAESEIAERLESQLPAGLAILAIEALTPDAPKGRVGRAWYQVDVPSHCAEGLADRASQLRDAASCMIQRPHRNTTVDLSKSLEALAYCEGVLSMRLKTDDGAAGPRDVLTALGLTELEREGACLARTTVELAP
jgi:radical SAM-linked protein